MTSAPSTSAVPTSSIEDTKVLFACTLKRSSFHFTAKVVQRIDIEL
jgi:hypothetical protein